MTNCNDPVGKGNSILSDIYNACTPLDPKGDFSKAAYTVQDKGWLELINKGIETPEIT